MDQKVMIAISIGLITLFILMVLFLIFFRKSTSRHLKKLRREIDEKDKIINDLSLEKQHFLNEKRGFVKEMQDRVINNLQIVMSLLNTQSFYLEDVVALKALQTSQQRLYAISLIHHALSESENYAFLNIRNYTYELAESLMDRMDAKGRIHVDIQVVDLLIDLAQGAPLGMIMNEAIVNALTHGFPEKSGGTVLVSLTLDSEKNLAVLDISDNGKGFPSAHDIDKRETFGIRLMEGLSEQLGGQFSLKNGDGVKIRVSFTPGAQP